MRNILKMRKEIIKEYMATGQKEMVSLELKAITLDADHHTHFSLDSRDVFDLDLLRAIEDSGKEEALDKSNRRWEHIIPKKVLRQAFEDNNDELIDSLLEATVIAGITLDNDAKLTDAGLRMSMPAEFYLPGSSMFANPYARYMAIGLELYNESTGLPIDFTNFTNTIQGV